MLRRLLSLENRVWAAASLNVMAMAMQVWAVVSARSSAGVSRPMLVVFVFVQLTFAQVGWQTRQWGQFWGMIISAALSLAVMALTFVY